MSELRVVKEAEVPVGGEIEIAEEDRKTIRSALEPMLQAQAKLGAVRMQYLLGEQKLAAEIDKFQSGYVELVKLIGRKHGLDVDGAIVWNYDANKGTYTRTK